MSSVILDQPKVDSNVILQAEEMAKGSETKFKELFITTSEICEILGISKPNFQYIKTNIFPEPIKVNPTCYIYEREVVMPLVKKLQEAAALRAERRSTM